MSAAPFKQQSATVPSRVQDKDFNATSRVEPDSIGLFKSEGLVAHAPASALVPSHSLPLRKIGGVVLACAVIGAGSWLGFRAFRAARTVPATSAMGTAAFNSSPNGASIVIDGVARGITPLKLALAAGPHSITIPSNGVSRTLPLSVDAGAAVSQYVELAVDEQSARGSLEIASEPAGAEVRIDGTLRGVAPLVVSDLPIGQHKVTVSNGDTTVNRTVNVTGGATA